MTIHREGYKTIAIVFIAIFILHFILFHFLAHEIAFALTLLLIAFWLFIVSFFRIPKRELTVNANKIIAPADGKVVAIEEIYDEEFFKQKVIQLSIFMSPLNVHVNRNPVDGEVIYSKYHPGKYLAAWHPKSSTENERWSVVVKNSRGTILYKQIAGAVARRICNYVKVDEQVRQNNEFGFIKFGSRVDVLLPLGTVINVEINKKVKGGITAIAAWQ